MGSSHDMWLVQEVSEYEHPQAAQAHPRLLYGQNETSNGTGSYKNRTVNIL